MLKDKVKTLLDEALDENPNLFLIDFEVRPGNQIVVVIDGDKGVSVNDCIEVSRKIEHNLDREEEDFSIDVTSAGATSPLKIARQYKKNIGRKLSLKTEEDQYEGDLVEANEDFIKLTWKAREPKPVGKGKHTVKKEVEVAYPNIKEAKVIIKF